MPLFQGPRIPGDPVTILFHLPNFTSSVSDVKNQPDKKVPSIERGF